MLRFSYKQCTVLGSPNLHVFGLNLETGNWNFGTRYEAVKTLRLSLSLCYTPHFLALLHVHTSWFCIFLFPLHIFFCFFSFPLPLYFLHSPPPSGPVEPSSVCGGVSPVPPVLSLSRSIKRRRTHAGCLKSPPTLPYGWWTGRCSNRTTLSRQEELPSHLLLYPCHWFPLQPWRLVSTVLSFVDLCSRT